MSLKLILTRHAKSDWGEPGLKDHDRPLNGRGQRDAPRIGAWLAAEGHMPEAAFVSSALRTQMTWAAMAEALPNPATTTTVPQIYEASSDTILQVIRNGTARTQAIIGHNPGIGETMHLLAQSSVEHPRWNDIPTGATLVLRFSDRQWSDIAWGDGEVMDFITPHDL